MYSVHVTLDPDGSGKARITNRRTATPCSAQRRTWVSTASATTMAASPETPDTPQAISDLAAIALARVGAKRGASQQGGHTPVAQTGNVAALATLLCAPGDAAVAGFLHRLERNMPLARLADELLAPAMYLLGLRWDADRITSADVAIAASRLERYLIVRDRRRPVPPVRSETALFAALPRQRHLLGLRLAAASFREEGWGADLLLGGRADDIVARAKARRPDVIGLSVSRRQMLPDMHRLILRLRALPTRSRILIGGSAAPRQIGRAHV